MAQLPGGLRKEPLQERSKAAIRRVLDVATELILEQGADAIIGSPALLLERSGISRGSFYAFFETPERVLDELALQNMRGSREEIMRLMAARPMREWREIVDTLVEQYWGQFRIPLVRELWAGQHLTPGIQTLDRTWVDELAVIILGEFHRHAPMFEQLSFTQCAVSVQIMERLSQYAFRENVKGDPLIKEEIRAVLLGYFAKYE